jgi:RNA polymerase sigma-70 factor (ECF subfamily)
VAKTALNAMHLPFRERSDTDVSDLLQAKELEQRLHAVIEELSPQSREAFKLSRFDQLPYKLIAARLNVSVGTVERHISKALRILRKELSETDYLLLIGLVLSGISLNSTDNAHLLLNSM